MFLQNFNIAESGQNVPPVVQHLIERSKCSSNIPTSHRMVKMFLPRSNISEWSKCFSRVPISQRAVKMFLQHSNISIPSILKGNSHCFNNSCNCLPWVRFEHQTFCMQVERSTYCTTPADYHVGDIS